MKLIKGFPVFLLLLGLHSCFEAPDFPVVPQIEFDSIVFRETPPGNQDTLKITIRFKDGDGDLGLSSSDPADFAGVYRDRFYYVDNDGQLVVYSTRRKAPIYEELLPPYEFPYYCTNWSINPRIGDTVVNDTVYFESNPDHYNIFVEYYVKNPNGTFSLFDWQLQFCESGGTNFNGRFPLLKDQSRPSPLEGRLTYSMNSLGFRQLFNLRILKLRVTIQDRALNKSNTIETPEFTLDEIKIN